MRRPTGGYDAPATVFDDVADEHGRQPLPHVALVKAGGTRDVE